MTATVIVIAKAPRAGVSKTRLCPPLTYDDAARLASAALEDTIAAVSSISRIERVLVLDGDPAMWRRPGWRVVPQFGSGLDERIAAAFAPIRGPALLIGMDTPHVPPGPIARGIQALTCPGVDAVLGPALDGGYWAVGLRRPAGRAVRELFHGVPMTTSHTFTDQLARLASAGGRVRLLSPARDVDRFEDAVEVAALAPWSRFAGELRSIVAGRDEVAVP